MQSARDGRGRASPRTRAWALAAVRAACRLGRIDLAQAEERIDAIYGATTDAEVYTAIAGLPHPPAPLVIDDRELDSDP